MLSQNGDSVIVRIWHGSTLPDNADAYQKLLDTTIVPGIAARKIQGHRSTEVLRRRDNNHPSGDVEFITVMVFDTWDAIVEFAGGDGHTSVVPESARRLLNRFDDHSQHYEAVASHPTR